MTDQGRSIHSPSTRDQWWRDAVIYQIYPRSFASSRGPVGDLPGIASRLDYLRDLGVDAVWLSPFYGSPQHDAGYDVADYRAVDPRFGTLADAEALIARAHELGLRVVVDLVPNHTSWDHRWFREAIKAGPGSAERNRYMFRDGKNGGTEPPNNWTSVFGGPAWTRVADIPWVAGTPAAADQQYYLNLFDSSQPDLNWDNPEVHAEFRSILRFWLDRGVDGFRIDVAHGLVKDPALPDWTEHTEMLDAGTDADHATGHPVTPERPPMWDQDGVHAIYREWRSVLDEYGPDRLLVAEAWVQPEKRLARYVRDDEMNQAFNFAYLACPWDREALRRVVEESLTAMDAVGAPTTWVLSNHDVVRAASRLGLTVTGKGPNGIGPRDPQPDAEKGRRRARAWHMLTAALPGSYYIYQGEERDLPEATMLPDGVRQDPAFFRTNGTELGRDGCRVPLPWEAGKPGLGFSPTGGTWLPQPADWERFTVTREETDPDSGLHFFRRLLARRRALGLGIGGLKDVSPEVGGLAYINSAADHSRPDLLTVTAFDAPVPFPTGWRRRASSVPLDAAAAVIPPDTTVWFTR